MEWARPKKGKIIIIKKSWCELEKRIISYRKVYQLTIVLPTPIIYDKMIRNGGVYSKFLIDNTQFEFEIKKKHGDNFSHFESSWLTSWWEPCNDER